MYLHRLKLHAHKSNHGNARERLPLLVWIVAVQVLDLGIGYLRSIRAGQERADVVHDSLGEDHLAADGVRLVCVGPLEV